MLLSLPLGNFTATVESIPNMTTSAFVSGTMISVSVYRYS